MSPRQHKLGDQSMLRYLILFSLTTQSVYADHFDVGTKVVNENKPNQIIVRKHPLSPQQCGIDVIEVGVKNDVTNEIDIITGLWRDRFDTSFGDTKPVVRKIYDYSMPPNYKFFYSKKNPKSADEPKDIVNIGKRRKHLVAKLVWDLAQFATMSMPYLAPIYYITDEFVDAYVRRNRFHRKQVTQLLNYVMEHDPHKLDGILDINELKQTVAAGEAYTFGGLFVNNNVADMVWEFNRDSQHALRAQNYSRLVNILNREGLVARPLTRDYVVVYIDPTKEYARDLDTVHTDLSELPKIKDVNGTKLIPVAIYSIGQNSQRTINLDFIEKNRIRNRKALKYLVDLGVKAGVSFVALPYSLLIYITDKGVRFTLDKYGVNALSDSIDSEAELAMILQSGIAQISSNPELQPEQVEQAKKQLNSQQLNIFVRMDGKPESNRKANEIQMSNFLQYHSKELCDEANSDREKDYKQNYLTWPERTSRFWRTMMPFLSEEELAKERQLTIAERHEVISARKLLRFYDPNRKSVPETEVVRALYILANNRSDEDTDIITRIMLNPGTEGIELAAVGAARKHGSSDFAKPLSKLLEGYEFNSEVLNTDPTIVEAVQALSSLRYNDAGRPDYHYTIALNILNKKLSSPNLSESRAELTKVINKLNFEQGLIMERQWSGY